MAFVWGMLFVISSLFQLAASDVRARFCVSSDAAKKECEDMRRSFDEENLRQLTCVQADSVYACMRMVKYEMANLVKVDDTDIFAGGKFFQLVPILKESEDTGAETFLYKAVILVKADSNIRSLNDLYGKKSCHTGVGRTVGWTVPVAGLQARKVMTVQNCDNTVKNVADFFSQSCAPGAFEETNNVNGDNPANVCALCQSNTCPPKDKYSGYKGAVQCLLDGRGDVAFGKHSTIRDITNEDPSITTENLRLLCPDGTRKLVDEWANCFWATRPTDVVMTSSTLPAATVGGLRNLLMSGAQKFNNDTAKFNMFSSEGSLFSKGTKHLLGVSETNYSAYLGTGYMYTMTNYSLCPSTDRWCVVSLAEENKCKEMSAAFAAARITSKMMCVRADTHQHCMEKIQNGDADLVTLDGGDVYTGGKYHGLVPILSETYGSNKATSYWAVAVVKKSNTGVNFKNLKGKTSCHTGIKKTSGWNIPIGTLIEKGSIPPADTSCGIVEAVGKFFSKSCVPGALEPKYNPTGKNPSNLCELCGEKKYCKRDSSSKYYGYRGAFRCLVEKNADVAFVKHSTVSENTDGKLREDWAMKLKSADFELLCPDGTRAAISEWQRCNLAVVPSHAIVTSKEKSLTDRRHYTTILKKGQLKFGKDSKIFKMFATSSGKDAIFDDSTTGLVETMVDMQDYRKFLGSAYTSATDALDKKPCTSAARGQIGAGVVIVTMLVLNALSV